ncbi:MAG TPA: Calx-beta domain-containing protein [Thermoanaerobaculia bacterium]|nr:Calx-beta domain-containing protein [Thermoanaerobaculia bacterium]
MNVRYIHAAVAVLVLIFAPGIVAQGPSVVTTLAPPADGGSANASHFTVVGDAVYFYANPSSDTPAIWKWTEAGGAQRVKTVSSESTSSAPPPSLLALGDKLLFTVTLDSRGTELWITDGTPAGTSIVKDIYVGGSSSPVLMIASGTKAYFTAYDPEHGRELWITDGTLAGTVFVKDLTGDSDSSYPAGFVQTGGKVYFHTFSQLWVSDGTEAGTIALASGVNPVLPGVLNGEVFFLGSDDEHGRELWSTDGTIGGTAMVKDINSGPASSWGGIPTNFVQTGNALLFFAEDATNGRELWSTDGTAGGTQLVADLTPGAASTSLDDLVASAAGAFFLVDDTTLWFTDGTEAGTTSVDSWARVYAIAAAANGAFLVADDHVLVFSDGTAAGTTEIADVAASTVPGFTAFGSSVIFNSANSGYGNDPWISDGTDGGTHMLADIAISQYPLGSTWMRAVGNNAFFRFGSRLFASNGTAAGTIEVGTLGSSYYYESPPAAALGSTFLFFGGSAETAGLWKSNGTVGGTSLVKPFTSITSIFGTSAGYALFGAPVSYSGTQLWRTDGTAAGTQMLAAVAGDRYVEHAGRTYFLTSYQYSERWTQLWMTDGTADATRLVTSGQFSALTAAGGALYLGNFDSDHGMELWKSDGTADGLTRVKDIAAGTSSSEPRDFVVMGNLLIFTADDRVHGRELWRSDGTAAGTFMLRDLTPGASGAAISDIVASGRYVYFRSNYYELWRTDGTTAGTIRLTDPSTLVYLHSLTPFDGKLMLAGQDFRGVELWESDGSPAGTFIAHDLVAGGGSSNPAQLTVASDRMFFMTGDAKLWVLPRATRRLAIHDSHVLETDAGSTLLQFTVVRSGDLSVPTTVSYATEDVTATAGADYQAASGAINFAAGEGVKTIAITILGDTTRESNESLAVKLVSAPGATIVRDRAFGVIEENDRKVALSIEYVPAYSSSWSPVRTFRVTNSGPSGATVTLHVSESPYETTFNCDGKNPSVCRLGFVPAGKSVDFKVTRGESRALTETGIVPGRTLTATVSALETEEDLSDNTIARMIDANGTISLPAALVAGTTATAHVASSQGYPATVQLSLSGGVVVSPGAVTVTQDDRVAELTLTVAPNAWGWSEVRSGSSTAVMRIPIVQAGEPVLLDTSILPTVTGYYGYTFSHDEPVVLPVRVAATLPDGTLPSGSVELRTSDGTVLQAHVLDGDASATFTLNGLAVGLHEFFVAYDGDEFFHPVTIELPEVRVQGWSTSTDAVIVTRPCGDTQIVATVTNAEDHTPTGSVRFTYAGTVIATLPLVAVEPGMSRVTLNYAFPNPYYTLDVTYLPDFPFATSYDYAYFQSSPTCPAPVLIASPVTASAVSLIWSDVSATTYEIVRAEAPSRTNFVVVGNTSATSFVDGSAIPGKAYLYKVHAKNAAGTVRSTSAADLATTVIFTDDPIVFRSTRIKAVHVMELHQAVNAVRALAGLAPATFTPVVSGAPVKPVDVTPLRTALNAAFTNLGMPAVTWVDGLASSQPVKAMHVQQMRNSIK